MSTTTTIGLGLARVSSVLHFALPTFTPTQYFLLKLFCCNIPPLLAWQLHHAFCRSACQYTCLSSRLLHRISFFDPARYSSDTIYTIFTSCFTHDTLGHFGQTAAGYATLFLLAPWVPRLRKEDVAEAVFVEMIVCNLSTAFMTYKYGVPLAGRGGSGVVISLLTSFGTSFVLHANLGWGWRVALPAALYLGIETLWTSWLKDEESDNGCHLASIGRGVIYTTKKWLIG